MYELLISTLKNCTKILLRSTSKLESTPKSSDTHDDEEQLCMYCGNPFTGPICPKCGQRTGNSSDEESDERTSINPSQNKMNSDHLPAVFYNQQNVKVPAFTSQRNKNQFGTILIIVGMGVSTLLVPFTRSFLVSLLGFVIVAIGIWMRAHGK